MSTPITFQLVDRDGTPLAGLSGEPLIADHGGIVYTLQGAEPVAVGAVIRLPDGRHVLAAAPAGGGDLSGLGESWWVRNRQLIAGAAAGAAGAGLVASAATPGTGFNQVLSQGVDAARQFFLPGAEAASTNQAPMPSPPVPSMPLVQPIPASTFDPGRFPAGYLPGNAPALAKAGIGGISTPALVLGGLGLGMLALLMRKKMASTRVRA